MVGIVAAVEKIAEALNRIADVMDRENPKPPKGRCRGPHSFIGDLCVECGFRIYPMPEMRDL